MEYLSLPTVLVHPKSIVLYGKRDYAEDQYPNTGASHLVGKSKKSSNNLSAQSIRKAKKAISYLIYTSSEKKAYSLKSNKKFKFKVSFITLTLSDFQHDTDKLIKQELFHQFLIEARKKWKMHRYVWRQEYQKKTGNIHFHLLTNVFIPHNELRNCWNRIQKNNGYLNNYFNHYGSYNPNSTDNHSVKKVKDVAKYITKYMVKGKLNHIKKKREVTDVRRDKSLFPKSVSNNCLNTLRELQNCGRVLGCSYDLSNIRGAESELYGEFQKEIELMKSDSRYIRYDDTYFSTIYIKQNELDGLKYPNLYKLFVSYIYNTFGHSVQSEIFNDLRSPEFYN